MIQVFKDVNIDWLGQRRFFIGMSVLLMLVGMGSALYRHKVHPNGTEAFNLGVDFKGGTVVTVQFRQRPSTEAVMAALEKQGLRDTVVQNVTDKADLLMIKLPLEGPTSGETTPSQTPAQNQPAAQGQTAAPGQTPAPGQTTPALVAAPTQVEVNPGQARIRQALTSFGAEADPAKALKDDPQAGFKVVGTEAVGPVAGQQLRNKAIAVTLAALIGILLFIAFRFEWTYGAAAVVAVFHTVLVTLGLFSIFQIEINLTVIAALLTLVGFDVNDSIVVFDRIRENRKLYRRMSLYEVTNLSINQTLSRTVITSGLVFLSVISLVLFGGTTLRPFSLALLFGVVFGTYDSIAIASPIMVWWEQRLERANRAMAVAPLSGAPGRGINNMRGNRETAASGVAKQSRGVGRG